MRAVGYRWRTGQINQAQATHSRRHVAFLAIGIVLCVLVFAALLVPRFINAEKYRQQVEISGAEKLQTPVVVDGGLAFRFLTGIQLLARDVRIGEEGEELLVVPQVLIGLSFLPLLKGRIVIDEVTVRAPELNIIRHADGSYNFTRPDFESSASVELDLQRITIRDGVVVFRQMQEAPAEERSPVTISNIQLSAQGSDNGYEIQSLTMDAFGAQGSADLQVIFRAGEPQFALDVDLPEFAAEQVFASFMNEEPAQGLMSFSAQLSAQGSTMDAAIRTLAGQVSLRGTDLILHGSNLDAEFERFEDSQEFNLVDVGAFFFAGPAGVIVTKGYDFASILQASGEQTRIRQVISEWTIAEGIASAADVAMATERNRVAMQGALDLPGERFDDVTIALLNSRGCATVTQKVSGQFREPDVERPNVLESLAGPVLELIDDIRDRVGDVEPCEVFYTGSLEP